MARCILAMSMFTAVAAAQGGRVDTIGGTTYDWQICCPIYRKLVCAPGYGIHAAWMWAATESPWPDRTIRYNFYGYATRQWSWISASFMESGVNMYSQRTGFGGLDCDPQTQVPVYAAHGGSPLRPIASRDLAVGSGTFEQCDGAPNAEAYLWPVVGITQNRTIHCGLIDDATQDRIWYSRVSSWCDWAVPTPMAVSAPEPLHHSHGLAASKVSQRVVLCWVDTEGVTYRAMYFRLSADAGGTWTAPAELPPPPAYGGDTVTSYFITAAFPFFDRRDRLHFVVDVYPIVRDTGRVMPAEIWHWCESNSPRWSEIHRAGCAPENLLAPCGYNTLYAGRPTIGDDDRGRLCVAWEQFDSANVEPATNLLRADVFVAGSSDNGRTWNSALKLTEPGEVSHRYPCIVDYVNDDTLRVWYEVDVVAGFYVQGEGPMTRNPMVVRSVPVAALPGVESEPAPRPDEALCPTVVRGAVRIEDRIPETGYRAELLDAAGRRVMELRPGANDVRHLAPGVHFVRRGDRPLARVILLR